MRRERFTTDPREIARLRRKETAGAVPLYAAEPTTLTALDFSMHLVAMAYCDVRQHRPFADMWRLLRQAEGDCVTQWRLLMQRGRSQAVLRLFWTNPVELKAKLVFSFRAHRPFLALAAETGRVYITNRRPAAAAHLPETIIVQPDGAELTAALILDRLMEVRR